MSRRSAQREGGQYLLCYLLLITTVLLTATRAASAQGLVYGIAGAAGNSGGFGGIALHAAGGGELLINGRAGAGGEVGLLTNGSSILSITSINGVAHLFGQSDRNSPFVTAGYSRFSSGDGSFNAFNFGVGADFWRSENGAVRVEFRDHVRRRTFGDAVHYFSIRAGVAFR